MGWLSGGGANLDPSFNDLVLGGDEASRKNIARIQTSIRSMVQSGEDLLLLAADAVDGKAVMVVTNQRVLYTLGSKSIDFEIPKNRIARTGIKQLKMTGGRHSHKFIPYVESTGPLKHLNIKNFYLDDNVISITRWDYEEANLLCRVIDTQLLGL